MKVIGWVVNLAKGQTLFILKGKILLLALKVILRKLLIEFMGPTKFLASVTIFTKLNNSEETNGKRLPVT